MDNKKCINFQISLKNNLVDLKREKTSKDSIMLVRRAITSICSIFSDKQLLADTTFAIRYLKDSSDDLSHVKTYFVVGRSQNKFSSEEIEVIEVNINATLGRIFKLNPCQLDWRNLNCINTISEVIKHEIFDEENNLYIPKFLKTSKITELEPVLDYMETLDSKIVLEVCLQPYHQPNEQKRWMEAMKQMIQVIQSNIQNNPSSKIILDEALIEYLAYQKHYLPDAHLFGYAIRAYGEKQSHVQALLHTFKDIVISHEHSINCTIIHSKPQSEALAIQGTSAIERSEWKNSLLANAPINRLNQTAKIGWEKFGDGSLNVDNLFNSGISLRQTASWNQQLLPQEGSHSSQIVPNVGNRKITHNQIPVQKPITIIDLKPLHRLVCLEEIQGFLGLDISRLATSISSNFPEKFTIHDVLEKFGNLITEDTYVAGIDREGNPCISDFSKLTHRLVGGTTGTGKTNYILSVIYQFLYANAEREIYMIDFQAGLHYEFTIGKRKNVTLVTTHQECAELLQKMINIHSQRREEMKKFQTRDLDELLTKSKQKLHRILLVIDEAFQIKNCDERDIRKNIERDLNILASMARATGIHIVYCTQTPTSDVIDPQTLNNIGERVLLAIESASDSRRIIGTDEAYELPLTPKGRALFKGLDRLPIQIATPFIPDEVW